LFHNLICLFLIILILIGKYTHFFKYGQIKGKKNKNKVRQNMVFTSPATAYPSQQVALFT